MKIRERRRATAQESNQNHVNSLKVSNPRVSVSSGCPKLNLPWENGGIIRKEGMRIKNDVLVAAFLGDEDLPPSQRSDV